MKSLFILLLIFGTVHWAMVQPSSRSFDIDQIQLEYWNKKAEYDSILWYLNPKYKLWKGDGLDQPIAETYKFYISALGSKKVENLKDSILYWKAKLEAKAESPIYVNFFNHLLAEQYFRSGSWEEASQLLQKVAYSRQMEAKYPRLSAESLSMLAYMQAEERDFDASLRNTRKADSLLISHFGEDYAGRIMVLNNYGIIYGELGQLEKSLEYAMQTRKLTQLHYSQEHTNQSISLNNLSVRLIDLGRYDESVEVLKEALMLNQRQERNVDIFMNYMNLAAPYISKWDYDKALNYLKLAESMITSDNGEIDPYRIYLYTSMIAFYFDLKDYEAANAYLQKALDFGIPYYNDYSYPMGSIYYSLGNLEMEKGNFQEAVKFHEKALEIYQLYYGDISSKVASVKFWMSNIFEKMGSLDKAIEFIIECNEIYEQVHGSEHRYTLEAKIKLAELYAEKGDLKLSNKILNKVFDRKNVANGLEVRQELIPYEELIKDVNLINALELKITLLSRQINDENRLNKLLEIARAYEYLGFEFDRLLVNYGGFKSRDDLRKNSETVFKKAVETCYKLYELSGEEKWAEKAFLYSERARALKIQEIMRDRIATNHSGLPDSVLRKELELKTHLKSLENQLLETDRNDSLVYESVNKSFLLINQEYTDFIRQLEYDYTKYFDLKYNVDLATPHEIRSNLLNDKNSLIQYCLLDSVAYVHVVGTKDFHFLRLDIQSGLDEKVKKWYQGMKSRNFQSSDIDGQDIYEEFLQPIYNLVSESDWIIVPDGALYYVNFESLPIYERNGDYILQHHRIQYCYSPTVQIQSTKYNSVGDSSYDWVGFVPGFKKDASGMKKAFVEQPWATKAANSVAGRFNSKLFSGQDANITSFIKYASQGQILHMGTHAVADDEDPLQSYFVLAGQDESYDLLYANEIFNSEIDAKCAVLTACETGVGQIKAGEGMVSLARAFSYAGCPNIILTLWPVDDEQTGTLIESFYKYVAEGMHLDEALHEAKKDYLREARGELKHPYYWAGFMYYGSRTSLSKTSPVKSLVLYSISIIGLVLLVGLLLRRKKINGKEEEAES